MESGIYITCNKQGLKDVQVQFGGKIGVAHAYTKDNSSAMVIMQELNNTYKPGESVENEKYNYENFNIKLVFNDITSIKVLEKHLNDAKLHLLGRKTFRNV